MANERYGLMCPICKDACYFGKTLGSGVYVNTNYSSHLETVYNWMWKHLIECHKQFQWGAGNQILFTVIHEGHSDLDMSEDKHWNRHQRLRKDKQ